MQLFPVRNAPIKAGLARQLLPVMAVLVFSLFMVLTGAGLFWTLITLGLIVVIIVQVAVGQWGLLKSVGLSDEGITLQMLAGDVTYEWQEVVSVSVRTLREYGPLIRISTLMGGIGPSQPFVHVDLRRFVRITPFGVALPGRVPFIRHLGFILEDAEAFVAAARGHLSN